MNLKDNEFDRQLREKLHGFTPDVPEGLWGKIAARLDVDADGKSTFEVLPKSKTVPGWWLAAAAALVILALGFWINRPVEVIYLQGNTETADGQLFERPAHIPSLPREDSSNEGTPLVAVKVPDPRPKPQRSAPIKRASAVKAPVSAKHVPDRHVAVSLRNPKGGSVQPPTDTLKTYIVQVPSVDPPVVLDDIEEEMLATAPPSDSFGAGQLLNWVVGAVDQRAEKAVTFASDGEGSLRIDFNFGLAKNRKKK